MEILQYYPQEVEVAGYNKISLSHVVQGELV